MQAKTALMTNRTTAKLWTTICVLQLFIACAGSAGVSETSDTPSTQSGNCVQPGTGAVQNIPSVSSFDTIGTANNIAVSGNYAYVADGTNGLLIFDIFNKANPVLTGIYNTPGEATNVVVQGSYAFVADGSSRFVVVLNISNPASPVHVNNLEHLTASSINDIFVSGAYLFLVSGSGASNSRLYIWNISNPASAVAAGSFVAGATIRSIFVSGNYAYLAETTSGLRVINITNPNSPSMVALFDTPGTASDIFVSGNTAYVADGSAGVQIVDVTTPAAPVLLGSYDTDGTTNDIFVKGNYAYLADTMSIKVLNVAVPASPTVVAERYLSGAVTGVHIQNNYLYIAHGATGFEIAHEDNMPPLTSVSPAGGTYAANISVSITVNEAATTYFTLDGTAPTSCSSKYTGPLALPVSTIKTLKYFAIDTRGYASTLKTESYVVDTPPVAANVEITGVRAAGAVLSAGYTYSDAQGHAEGATSFFWCRSSSGVFCDTYLSFSRDYTVTPGDVGQYLAVTVYPVAAQGNTTGAGVTSAFVLIPFNQAPVANGVSITGNATQGQALTGAYTYSDADGDSEGASEFRWLVAESAYGPFEQIAGASSATYTILPANVGKYLKFQVKPVASAGQNIQKLYLSPAIPVTYGTTGLDADGDGVADATDNCPAKVNFDQRDFNNNGIGDVCDATYQPTVTIGNLMFKRCAIGQTGAECDTSGTAPQFNATLLEYCLTANCSDGSKLNGTGTSPAYSACSALNSTNYAGYNNWRVPTYDELEFVLDGNFTAGANTRLFPNIQSSEASSNGIWVANSQGNYAIIASVSSYGMGLTAYPTTEKRAVMCVRSASGGDTVDLSPNTAPITYADQSTVMAAGLMWRKCAIGQDGANCDARGAAPEYGARKYAYCLGSGNCGTGGFLNGTGTSPAFRACSDLNTISYAGFTNWRVPRLSEFQALVDTNYPYRINTNLFPNFLHYGLGYNVFWSADLAISDQGISVSYYSGGLSYGGNWSTSPGYIMCVRNP